ncbi:MAG: hypothetical protein LUF04_16010 [Bacteroides sp.]|nr:hypothetical protein [Bacteroides sp.]MCD8081836.1 hypothetical protein [Bacteroides sp.]
MKKVHAGMSAGYPEKEEVQEYGFSNKDINITFTQESYFITEWTVPLQRPTTRSSDQTMEAGRYNHFVSDWDDLELCTDFNE